LIKTFKKFIKNYPDYYLVLAGKKDYFYKRLINKYYNEINLIFPDFVEDKQLANYYQSAKAYIFPSKYEGFGLPPLEAMAKNLPVLSSSAGPMPEILQSAAKYFDPENTQQLLQLMKDIVEKNDLRQQLILAGSEQIKKYSWQKMAQETLDIYKEI